MTTFAQYLTDELHQWQDDVEWLSAAAVQEMLVAAAGKLVTETSTQVDVVRLRREIEPEDLQPATIVEVAEESMLLLAPEVAWLRALLLSHDETAPAQPGEPLAVSTQLIDGSVISVVTEAFVTLPITLPRWKHNLAGSRPFLAPIWLFLGDHEKHNFAAS